MPTGGSYIHPPWLLRLPILYPLSSVIHGVHFGVVMRPACVSGACMLLLRRRRMVCHSSTAAIWLVTGGEWWRQQSWWAAAACWTARPGKITCRTGSPGASADPPAYWKLEAHVRPLPLPLPVHDCSSYHCSRLYLIAGCDCMGAMQCHSL